jgi:hypothetical protein
MHLEDLLETFDVILGFVEMGLKPLFEAGIRRFFDHIGQGLHDLLFGILNVAQLMHEQLVERFDILTKEAHRYPRCG